MTDTATPAEPSTPPLDTRALRRTFGRFPTGVAVVTCVDPDGALVGVTANSFSSVSLEPPLVAWSLDRGAHSFEAFSNATHFAFSFLSIDQVEVSNRFARQGGPKFDGVEYVLGVEGVPLLPNCAAYIECKAHTSFPGGDHLILVGEVVRFSRHAQPALVFADGRYSAVAPHPGTEDLAAEGSPAERHPYDDFLLPLLFRAYTHVFANFADSLQAEAATGAQMRVLSVLAAHGPLTDGALLTRSLLSQSSRDEACDALQRQGFIASQSASVTAITDAGRKKLGDLLTAAAERERQSTAELDPAETRLLRTLLRKLVQQHEKDDKEGST